MKFTLSSLFISTLAVVGKASRTLSKGKVCTHVHDNDQAFNTGVYRINNVASGSELKSYPSGPSPIIADDVLPGVPYGIWEITKAGQGGFSIRNMGLGTNLTATELNPYVIVDSHGVPATTFAIQPAGFDQFVIKLPYDDLVWTMDPVGNPSDYSIVSALRDTSTIPLRAIFMKAMMKPANGSPEQRFRFKVDVAA
ncbi:hypothetical protein BDQ17DRAFT_1420127 [Cyathus striatus]|nr:hypothetical protein BDQ17DRAFT_1420127 [Cyathus striatus]